MGKAPRPPQYASLLVEGLSSIKKKCLSYDFHCRNGDSGFPQRLHSFETNSCLWASLLGCSDSRASSPPNSTKARSFFLVAPTGWVCELSTPGGLGFWGGSCSSIPPGGKRRQGPDNGQCHGNIDCLAGCWGRNPSGGACLWTGARHPSPVGKKKPGG